MKTIIGIRREDKNQWEKRAPLIPSHVKELVQSHPLEIWVQPSSIRIFPDSDYSQAGARVEENLSPCPVVLAVKEIPLDFFEEGKTYIFFSHTIKGQPHSMPMLKKMMDLKCTLIDYEKISDEKGQRLLFFGKQAGQAGMIDTLWSLGQRLDGQKKENPFSSIKQAFQYGSLVEAREEIEKTGWKISKKGLNPDLVPLVCGFAGYGHVSRGAQEIFDLLPYEEIPPENIIEFFKKKNYSAHRIYKSVFKEEHMVEPVSSEKEFELQDYYDHPEEYRSKFETYLPYLTVLVNCVYWTPDYPRFVTKKYLKQLWQTHSDPRLKVIGDISCDVDGSVECTVRSTSPGSPVFVYDPVEDKTVDGVGGRGVVVMAVDNLPAELSLESSVYFSGALKPLVSSIAQADYSGSFADCSLPGSVKKAVILFRGEFTPDYQYLKKFI
ncbi:MAG: bifunctional lysine ketoglutarate reductase /saccharopine dehydrogenase family protein [Candidatus Aminicenantes bacterium]